MWVELGAQGQVDFSGAFTVSHTKYGHKASHPSGREGGTRGTDRCLKSRSTHTGPHVAPSPKRAQALLQKPRTPLGQRLRAQRGLLSARLLCLVMWLGQTQGHVKSDMKSPPERQMVTRRGDRGWKSRDSSQAKTLCPVGEWSPSCYPEHPEGLSPRWAGSLSGHTMGGGAPNM